MLTTVVTTMAIALALSADASAATVKVKADCSFRYYCSWEVIYTAAPGEVNDVTVTSGDGYVDIRDAGAPISGCAATEPQAVRCTTAHGEFARVDIALGDGDDLARRSANFDGGEGQDTISGGGRLDGGPGRDHLSSTAGALFADADNEPDRFDGSPTGTDGIDYTGRGAGVRVDLRRGRTAEGDVFTSVENLIGSLHDDVLIGTDGPNELVGHAGADRLVGLGGNDQLFSYLDGWNDGSVAGREVLEGGPGDDELTVGLRSRAGTVSRCGPGRDELSHTWARDFVSGDCERLVVGDGGSFHFPVHLRVRERVFYRDKEPGRITARAGGHVVARGTRQLRLNALGRRLLEQRGRLRIAITVRDRRDVYGFRTELR